MSSIKAVRAIRSIPPEAYRLPTDGRKWLHDCKLRKYVVLQLATYADANGTRIFPSARTIGRELGISERTVKYVFNDLKTLGVLIDKGFTDGKYKHTRIRALDVEKICGAVVQDSPESVVQDSPTVVQDSQDACARFEERSRKIQNSGTPEKRESCTQPSLTVLGNRTTNQPTNEQPGALPLWVSRLWFEHNHEVLRLRKVDIDAFLAVTKQYGESTIKEAWEKFIKVGTYNEKTKFPAYLFFRDARMLIDVIVGAKRDVTAKNESLLQSGESRRAAFVSELAKLEPLSPTEKSRADEWLARGEQLRADGGEYDIHWQKAMLWCGDVRCSHIELLESNIPDELVEFGEPATHG